MKKLSVLFLLLMLISCDGRLYYYPPKVPSVHIISSYLFVCDRVITLEVTTTLPVEIYNPNNYPITVTADKIDYLIAPLGTLELQDFDK